MSIRIRLFILFILMGINHVTFAQFNGVIHYDITYNTYDNSNSILNDLMPSEAVLYIQGEVLRMNQKILGGASQSFMYDAASKYSVLLMSLMGQEYMVNLKNSELLLLEESQPLEIVKTYNGATIAGQSCQLAYALSGQDSLEIYYSSNLQSMAVFPQFAAVEGLPLKYEVKKGDLHITYTATSVAEEKVDSTVFELPVHVKEIPFEAFARSFAISK